MEGCQHFLRLCVQMCHQNEAPALIKNISGEKPGNSATTDGFYGYLKLIEFSFFFFFF